MVANAGRVMDHAAIICWWLAGAMVCSAALHYVVNRWIFPAQDQPRARKLFADLSAGLIYLGAGIGILNILVGPSLPGMLATSGVAAVVLRLALQSTLADLFSGLALNFERPFGAGEWIGIQGDPEGQIIEINWRATRLMTPVRDMVVIPNSNIAKAVVANHSRLNHHHLVTLLIPFPQTVSPNKIDEIVLASAAAVPAVLKDPAPALSMTGIANLGIMYEFDFYVSDYIDGFAAKNDILRRIWEKALHNGIEFPTLALAKDTVSPGSDRV
jgi:small-conductance mechanosensitive channel